MKSPALAGMLLCASVGARCAENWAPALTIKPLILSQPPRNAAPQSAAVDVDAAVGPLMTELHVPGVSVALIQGGKISWSGRYGSAGAGPVEEQTRFEAASMSKPIFAYLALKLVEEGKLDLDRPLVEYVKEPYLRDQPEHELITARMCLSHTTGFPNWREVEGGPLPILFKPGTRYGYSGEGMVYLQWVVEQVLGEGLQATADRLLFQPLGLQYTSFEWTPAMDADLASGHDQDGTELGKSKYEKANAAYTLYTTAEEYAKLLLETMTMKDKMLERQVEVAPGALYRGLGWALEATPNGDVAYHGGKNASGFRCYSQYNPQTGSGIVIMTNGGNSSFPGRLIQELGSF